MSLVDEKRQIRRVAMERLQAQTSSDRKTKSEAVVRKLRNTVEFQKSEFIMFYMPSAQEIDTDSLLIESIQSGKHVCIPWLDEDNRSLVPVEIHDVESSLVPGRYGLREPKRELVHPFDLDLLELVLVPGLAFDTKGRRLGRGKGYYDRFLDRLPRQTKRIGLAFDFQLFGEVPAGETDVPVDMVITN